MFGFQGGESADTVARKIEAMQVEVAVEIAREADQGTAVVVAIAIEHAVQRVLDEVLHLGAVLLGRVVVREVVAVDRVARDLRQGADRGSRAGRDGRTG